MEIKCLHGYFIFTEHEAGECSKLASLFDLDLALEGDNFTFDSLTGAPGYSILGGTYLGAPAIKTFEGKPWEIMKENKLVYDFINDIVVPEVTIIQRAKLDLIDYFYLSDGLILPGSILNDGTRVTTYSAWYSFDESSFKYSEVNFESDT